jgi:hypothetical protein
MVPIVPCVRVIASARRARGSGSDFRAQDVGAHDVGAHDVGAHDVGAHDALADVYIQPSTVAAPHAQHAGAHDIAHADADDTTTHAGAHDIAHADADDTTTHGGAHNIAHAGAHNIAHADAHNTASTAHASADPSTIKCADPGARSTHSSASEADAGHIIFMHDLGAVRHMYCKQRARVRSWDADSAGAVHGLRREHCHDRQMRRQLLADGTMQSAGEIATTMCSHPTPASHFGVNNMMRLRARLRTGRSMAPHRGFHRAVAGVHYSSARAAN